MGVITLTIGTLPKGKKGADMIIVMERNPVKDGKPLGVKACLDAVCAYVQAHEYEVDISRGTGQTVVGVLGDFDEPEKADALMHALRAMDGVELVQRVSTKYKLVSREFPGHNPTVQVNGVSVGGKQLLVIAGPCAVESEQQLEATARAVKSQGAHALRGGAYKPRTSPYSAQGLREGGVFLLDRVKRACGLPVVTEVTRIDLIALLHERADVLQVGMRNMANFELLSELARTKKPVLLKRNIAASLDDLLLAAEYIARGNPRIILCLRGIHPTRNVETRAQLDLDAIPLLKQRTFLPVIVDPSHPAGRADLVIPFSQAAIAMGADGLLVEVHPNPPDAISDNEQQLTFEQFGSLMTGVRAVAAAVGRTV
ncbi:MAG: 3-deoxy-7-phosphoheptulonate synthase [Patescibacteria group bacterium]|nr:3-deoxy-7-phosphoheptulonate synthase [Patescibacteria group bacterium]